MQYSPKLKRAMEQIKEILKENDIAGFVVLHTPGFSEYLNYLNTSYSCAKITDDGLTLRLKQNEVGKEKAKELAEGTVNMIAHFSDVIATHALLFIDAKKLLKQKLNSDEFRGGHTSHDQQNN